MCVCESLGKIHYGKSYVEGFSLGHLGKLLIMFLHHISIIVNLIYDRFS